MFKNGEFISKLFFFVRHRNQYMPCSLNIVIVIVDNTNSIYIYKRLILKVQQKCGYLWKFVNVYAFQMKTESQQSEFDGGIENTYICVDKWFIHVDFWLVKSLGFRLFFWHFACIINWLQPEKEADSEREEEEEKQQNPFIYFRSLI